MNPLIREIRGFIDEAFLSAPGRGQLTNDESFLGQGIIDSAGVRELVSFLEEKYPIRIADEELIPGNLDSINCLVDFLERKLAEAQGKA